MKHHNLIKHALGKRDSDKKNMMVNLIKNLMVRINGTFGRIQWKYSFIVLVIMDLELLEKSILIVICNINFSWLGFHLPLRYVSNFIFLDQTVVDL